MPVRLTEWPEGQEPTRYGTLDEFLGRSETPQGNVEIMHTGRPIHLNWQDRAAPTTLVMFTAAVKQSVKTVPIYSGRRVTASLDANILMISDPTLKADHKLTLGWYAGSTRHPNLQLDLTAIIRSLAGPSRIILFGGSGGGFPALEQATRLPGSTALLSNPLTHVNLVPRVTVQRYFELGWRSTPPENPAEAPFNHSVIETYGEPVDARVVCVQNARDHFHIEHYWQPFVDALHPENRVLTLSPVLGNGHVGPDKQSMTSLIETAIRHDEWMDLVAAMTSLRLTGPIHSPKGA